MSFGCERSCSSPRRVSNFNSKEPQGGIYRRLKFESVFTSARRTAAAAAAMLKP